VARARGVVVEVAVVGAHVYSPSEKVKGPAKGEGLVVYSRGPGGVSGGGDDVEKKGEQFTKVENREVGRGSLVGARGRGGRKKPESALVERGGNRA